MPTWPVLLERLAVRQFGDADGPAVYRALVQDGYSPPAIASVLEHLSSPAEFTEALREELYRDFAFFRTGVTDENRESFLARVQRNRTLRAVASLCAQHRPGAGAGGTFGRNPRIRAIVNFNFDALLREYTYERYRTRILRTVERPSKSLIPGRIPVYHVHGYFVFTEEHFNKPDKESPDLRVFTEQEYFDFFDQPTRMGSYVFLHLLRSYSCLFIGLSLKDDNIRRLLHYSLSERVEGYRREEENRRSQKESFEWAVRKSIRHFALLPRHRPATRSRAEGARPEALDGLTESSLRRLGVKPVWYEKHSEVPAILRQVYEAGGDDWDAVYQNPAAVETLRTNRAHASARRATSRSTSTAR